jgi:disulfide bond formation protein DsbB
LSSALLRRTSRRLPLAMALACVLAVGFALFAQYVLDMRPCPWCVLQRLLFLIIALLCVVPLPWRRVWC